MWYDSKVFFAIKFLTLNHGSQLLSDSWFDRQDSHPRSLFYFQIWTQPESCKGVKYLRNISKPWSLKAASSEDILGNMGCTPYLKPCIPHQHFLLVSSTLLPKSVLPVHLVLVKARLKELCQETLSKGWRWNWTWGKDSGRGEVFGVSCQKGFLSGMPFSIYKVVGLIISPISTGAKTNQLLNWQAMQKTLQILKSHARKKTSAWRAFLGKYTEVHVNRHSWGSAIIFRLDVEEKAN